MKTMKKLRQGISNSIPGGEENKNDSKNDINILDQINLPKTMAHLTQRRWSLKVMGQVMGVLSV